MRFVSVDIGNSRIKLRVSGESESQVARSEQTLAFLLPAEPLQWFVSSVNSEREQQLETWVQQQRPDDRWTVLQQLSIPLPVAVDHPSQVGKDRLLAALAARNHLNTVFEFGCESWSLRRRRFGNRRYDRSGFGRRDLSGRSDLSRHRKLISPTGSANSRVAGVGL